MHKILLFIFLAGLLYSCQDEKGSIYPSSPGNVRINTFTRDKIEDQYFWADKVRDKVFEVDSSMLCFYPPKFFYDMLYSEDKWSSISKKGGTGEVADADGYDNNFGYNLAWGDATSFVVAKVNFVFPGTPAEKAGLKRGDFIIRVNGGIITQNNTELLTNSYQVKLGIARKHWNQEKPDTTITLTARKNRINPVFMHKVIEQEDIKTGYVLYTDFVYHDSESLHQLDTLFKGFKTRGVTEFILDLRYNPGGYIEAAKHLCSLLAPESPVLNEELIITKTWNPVYQKRYLEDNNTAELEERFDKTIPAESRLNLDRLWVITSKATASASEVLISGLAPYMDVRVIGEKTRGKNMGGITFTPQDRDIKDWHITLITLEYKNSRGESVKNGIYPGHFLEEDFMNYLSLGDENEPLLKETLALIANKAIPRSRSFKQTLPQFIPRQASEPILLFKHR